jgi:DNA-binding GntR family transcriptional regulator
VAAQRVTVAEEVYRALKHDIITLERQPGASLTEQELAAAYGSSRVPVREACRRLQQESLLTAVPYKGYFVNHVSLKDIMDSFDLRLVLETHAVTSAAERVAPADVERLEALATIDYTHLDWDSYADFLEHNQEFHLQLAAAGGNERLVNVLADLLVSMQRFFYLGLDLGDFGSEMRTEHEQLVEVLRRHDHDAARACVLEQITTSRDRILRALMDKRIDLPLR